MPTFNDHPVFVPLPVVRPEATAGGAFVDSDPTDRGAMNVDDVEAARHHAAHSGPPGPSFLSNVTYWATGRIWIRLLGRGHCRLEPHPACT